MSETAQNLQWVRIHLSSQEEIPALRRTFQAEVFRSTLRRIDARNVLIEAFVPKEMLAKLQAAHRVRVLGDVAQMTREAARHVSKINRYRTP